VTDQIEERRLSTADLAGTRQADNGDTAERAAVSQGGLDQHPKPAGTAAPSNGEDGRPTPLLVAAEAEDMRSRWSSIQIGFVDDPRHSVEMADSLVAEMMQRLAQVFATQHSQLEGQWSRGQDVSTEDLRVALRHYRSFFDRLLSF